MKRQLLGAALGAGMLLAPFFGTATASAQVAYGAPFQVSITYQNVSTSPANISINFYPEANSTAIPFSPPQLAAGGSTSLAVGNVSGLSGSFKGSAVLSADQQVIATVVQYATGLYNRPLSNGFGATDGSNKQLIATVLKNQFNNSTIFSVQNADSGSDDVTVAFYAVGQTTPVYTSSAQTLPAGTSKYFDAGTISQLGSSFNGSAVATAVQTGSTTAGKIVATVDELQTNGPGSKSFEGSSSSGATVYMPSALCNFGATAANTSYAIQNADSANSVTFVVDYKVGASTLTDGPFTLSSGAKQSVQGCAKMTNNSIGSAVIRRTAGTGTLVAVGKVGGGNITSAFLGALGGTNRLGLTYVRWSPDSTYNNGSRQRANIAIQNVGTAPATNVTVKYVDINGVVKATQSLGTVNPGTKVNSDPASAGALDSCGRFGEYGGGADCLGTTFGGGAIITADTGGQLAAIVRVGTGNPNLAGEDYSGINY